MISFALRSSRRSRERRVALVTPEAQKESRERTRSTPVLTGTHARDGEARGVFSAPPDANRKNSTFLLDPDLFASHVAIIFFKSIVSRAIGAMLPSGALGVLEMMATPRGVV